jgi:hypothetical protein
MAPHSRDPLPRRTSARQMGLSRDRWEPIRLAFANGQVQVHRTRICGQVPSADTDWPPELDAGGQSPSCWRVGPTGPGGARELPVTSCAAFLGHGNSPRARVTRFLESRSPTTHTVARFAGGGHP